MPAISSTGCRRPGRAGGSFCRSMAWASAFAGNVLLIDLAELQQRGWLPPEALAQPPAGDGRWVDYEAVAPWRMAALAQAHAGFLAQGTAAEQAALAGFCTQHAPWLGNYTL